jgi:hypothetical protein
MPRIAVSGHRDLPPAVRRLIDDALRAALHARPPVTGLSCLADGADQLFARAVLDTGGTLEAVIPAARYRAAFPEDRRASYDDLLVRAEIVHRLPHVDPDPEAHMAASTFMLDRADELWAVWDGEPARGYAGTADVVTHARNLGTPVLVIWPEGATRA